MPSLSGRASRRPSVFFFGVLVCAARALGSDAAHAQSPAAAPAAVLQLSSDPSMAATLEEAQRLLTSGRAGEAYQLLAARELEWSGATLYDYLLGLSALDSGKPRDAQFALQRVVAAESDFLGARIELARAYFDAGDDAAAREQFRYLRAQSPPATTRVVIDRYLAALDARGTLAPARWSALFQFGAGYDSNANGSTNDTQFLGFTLDPRNVELASGFAEALVGIGHTVATGQRSGWVSNAQLSHRANPDASFIDQSIVGLSTGGIWQRRSARLTVALGGTASWLDGERHDHSLNADVGSTWRVKSDWDLAVNLRTGRQRYADSRLEVMDTDRLIAGLALTRVNIGASSGRAGGALIVGRDDASHSGSPYGNDKLGVRAFAGWLLRPQSSIYLEAAALRADYRDGSFFGLDRRDDQYSATLALDFQNWPAAQWSVSPRVRYMKNDSNVELYQYDRAEAAIFVRRSF